MKSFKNYLIGTALSGAILATSYQATHASAMVDKVHPLIEAMINVFKSAPDAQSAVKEICKQGGLFRGKQGDNCSSFDYYNFYLLICEGVAGTKGSDCEKKGIEVFAKRNQKPDVGEAKKYIIKAITELKSNDATALACFPPREKLTGALKEVADAACEKQDATGRKRSRAISGESAAVLKVRPQITITASALRDLRDRRQSLALEQLLRSERDLAALKEGLNKAAEQGKQLQGAGKQKAAPAEQLQVLPKLAEVDRQAATALTNLKIKLETQRATALTPQELAEVEKINQDFKKLENDLSSEGVRNNPQTGQLEFYNPATKAWGGF